MVLFLLNTQVALVYVGFVLRFLRGLVGGQFRDRTQAPTHTRKHSCPKQAQSHSFLLPVPGISKHNFISEILRHEERKIKT